MIYRFLHHVGAYVIMVGSCFRMPKQKKMFGSFLIRELDNTGLRAFWVIVFVSVNAGAIAAVQADYALSFSFYVPTYLIGSATRSAVILEFSATFTSLILAGQTGSYIASSLATMRVSEQIDALEVMGVNSLVYLVFPKIIACVIFYPLLTVISMLAGMAGGVVAADLLGFSTVADFVKGARVNFEPFQIYYSLIKMGLFSFFIATIPAYFGYYVKGGAVNIGVANTNAIVWTSMIIVFFNYLISQILL